MHLHKEKKRAVLVYRNMFADILLAADINVLCFVVQVVLYLYAHIGAFVTIVLNV